MFLQHGIGRDELLLCHGIVKLIKPFSRKAQLLGGIKHYLRKHLICLHIVAVFPVSKSAVIQVFRLGIKLPCRDRDQITFCRDFLPLVRIGRSVHPDNFRTLKTICTLIQSIANFFHVTGEYHCDEVCHVSGFQFTQKVFPKNISGRTIFCFRSQHFPPGRIIKHRHCSFPRHKAHEWGIFDTIDTIRETRQCIRDFCNVGTLYHSDKIFRGQRVHLSPGRGQKSIFGRTIFCFSAQHFPQVQIL